MPRFFPLSRPRILERLELQAVWWEAETAADFQEALAVRGNEVHQSPTVPDVTMKPHTTIHGVGHTVATIRELLHFRVTA